MRGNASPSSAFAYAASGWAYLAMAGKARGGAYIRDTPRSNIEAMDRLLTEADADLQRAIALNPKITPAYVAMIRIGQMSFGDTYMLKAARRGLTIAPDSYAIYGMYSGAEEPRWGGTLQLMQQIADQAQTHVKENPLLILLKSAGPAEEYDVCNCNSSARWDAFPAVFDEVSSASLLFNAGYAANNAGHPDLAAIYLSEGLRFLPDASNARMRRDYALTNLRDSDWALEEANRWIKKWPQSPWGYSMRGYAYRSIADYSHAVPDLEKANTLDPSNTFPLIQLGKIYVYSTRDWEKGWDVANRLVHDHPQEPEGWIFRAVIQNDQPRDGLRDTIRYFIDHFGDDPDQAESVAEMRAMLPATPGKTDAAAKSARNP
jgi:tetratricopeptide (TPR) repeat protein